MGNSQEKTLNPYRKRPGRPGESECRPAALSCDTAIQARFLGGVASSGLAAYRVFLRLLGELLLDLTL